MLWLLASENKDLNSGIIEGTDDEIAFRIRRPVEDFRSAIKHLIENGFIEMLQPASTPLADSKQLAVPETETETEGEAEKEGTTNLVVQSPREQPKPEPVNNLPLKSVVEKAGYNPTYHAVTPHPRFNEVREYITHRLPHLNRVNATEVNRWLLEGADPEKDIFPTVDNAIEIKRGDIGSFKYFTRGVESSMRVRKEAAEQHERLMQKYGEEDQRAKERAEHGKAE